MVIVKGEEMADFFKKLKKGINKGTAVIGAKSTTLIEVNKVKSEMATTSRIKKDTLLELGTKVYTLNKEGSFSMEVIQELMTKISEAEMKISDLEARITQLQDEEKSKLEEINSDEVDIQDNQIDVVAEEVTEVVTEVTEVTEEIKAEELQNIDEPETSTVEEVKE